MVEKNCFMASLDIKDDYYSIPVDESSQKYLKFIWKEQLYHFCVLPNGLSPCPRWFTKLLKPPLAERRKSKHDIIYMLYLIYYRYIQIYYICLYRWYLSSRWRQGKLHHKYYRYCHTIKIFGVYRSCRKITIFTNPRDWYFRFHNKLSQHDSFIEEGEQRATCLPHKKNNN